MNAENLSVKTASLCLSFDTNRDGDAWLSLLTAVLTVHPIAERTDAGGEWRECEIVVIPLAKEGHHEGEVGVADHACVGCAQDVVGHLSHLRVEDHFTFCM